MDRGVSEWVGLGGTMREATPSRPCAAQHRSASRALPPHQAGKPICQSCSTRAAPVPVPLVDVLLALVQLGGDAVHRLQHGAARAQPHGAAKVGSGALGHEHHHLRKGWQRWRGPQGSAQQERQAQQRTESSTGHRQGQAAAGLAKLPSTTASQSQRALVCTSSGATSWALSPHRVLRGGLHLRAVGVLHVQHVARKLNHRNLQGSSEGAVEGCLRDQQGSLTNSPACQRDTSSLQGCCLQPPPTCMPRQMPRYGLSCVRA